MAAKIKLVNKDINHPDRIVFINPVLKHIWKQSGAFNKTLHQILPQETEESKHETRFYTASTQTGLLVGLENGRDYSVDLPY